MTKKGVRLQGMRPGRSAYTYPPAMSRILL